MTPVLTVVAGPNGSGKSTLVRAMGWHSIDPDRIAAGYGAGFSDTANLRSGREALGLVNAALANRKSLILETTLAARQPLRVMAQAREAGYQVHLVFVLANEDEDTRLRIDTRVLAGGHNIPDADLERRLPRILDNLPDAVALAGLTAIYVSSAWSRDFALEGAMTDYRAHVTVRVPEDLRIVLGTGSELTLVDAVSTDHPVAAVFPHQISQGH